jgi:hypothetical protein
VVSSETPESGRRRSGLGVGAGWRLALGAGSFRDMLPMPFLSPEIEDEEKPEANTNRQIARGCPA